MDNKARLHFNTAVLLMEGIEESMKVKPDKWGLTPPEHSNTSILRRLVQVRQEILQVQKSLKVGE